MGKEQELRPCPFCGGEGLVYQLKETPKLWRVVCKNCDAGPAASFSSLHAASAWNRRSSDEQAEVVGSPTIVTRNDLAGFIEFINEDVPVIVRDLDAPAAILLDMDTRKVVGYRVYDPASPPAVAKGGVTEAGGETDFGRQLEPGVMYANYSHDGNPMSDDRLEWLSRWHPIAEVRVMAGDLWQRRAADIVRRALAVREGWPKLASPLPWKYVSSGSPSRRVAVDWIEDDIGGIVVENVGHIDGPAIVAAVNRLLPTPPSRGEGE